ncbi:heme NO-binding domain-containing protein [Pontibacter anaerobius]|uniref:Heme NO-binding domain-containing protein n=1 Tax=Pontibacter anaerobius TaxID=2993940 RepID=A0ABT3RD64_9BACT|nr:heme NO-binding domain-containing protein [Pontibacter anaerobius]MCX2739787.1 heme NO-binding domain-containing protein [Pontibacter anaerobius]
MKDTKLEGKDALKEDYMHGSIFVLLKRFIESSYNYSTWVNLLEAAGVTKPVYEMQNMYPTRDLVAIVYAAAAHSGVPANDLLEQFGEFLVPDLLLVFNKYVQPEWRTYEMLLYTEASMHGAVRRSDSRTNPPLLLITKKGSRQLIVDYHSKRRMAGMAVGIINGIARYYNESDVVQVKRLTPVDEERVQIHVDFLNR